MLIRAALLAAVMLCVSSSSILAQDLLGEMPVIGEIETRHAKDIESSTWSIGCETLDRDFASYEKYKDYVGPLGAKSMRLQAGWAKCEKKKGEYDFAWLDAIVDHARSQGVRPWLETSYGNPLYEGGGGKGLGDGFPTSDEALAAWDKWVRALVARYKDRVNEWEIWNEPDLRPTSPVDQYIKLYIRTAEIIRAEQPKAKIYAMGLAGKTDYLEAFLVAMKKAEKTALIDAVTVHGYPDNPDSTKLVDLSRELAAKYVPHVQIRQGETGAPSTKGSFGALGKGDFNETIQAKYDLRRMMAHHGKGVPFNLFTLMELKYTTGENTTRMNTKGKLKSRDDGSVEKAKLSYYAAQRVFSIFDDSVTRVEKFSANASGERKPTFHGYTTKDGKPIVAVWFSDLPPREERMTAVDITIDGVKFEQPVYVDLIDGIVREIKPDAWEKTADGCKFLRRPIYDSPVLIAEKSALRIKEKK